MGKATVYAHLGDGLYSILYTPEITASVARIAELEAEKTALDEQLYSTNGLVESRTAAQAVYDFASAAFFIALDDWAACAAQLPPCDDQAALMQIVSQRARDRAESGAALTVIKTAIAENRSQYYAVTQEIAYLDNTKNGSGGGLMEAWCVDYSTDSIIPADTVVGTIETYGAKGGYAGGYLPRKWVNIQTSADPGYDAARDHCVKPLSGIKTAAMFYNWCQWLYVMSRNPQHAAGKVLSKLDPHQTYLDIELFGTTPGAAQPGGYPFDGGYSTILLNVPVEYLDCGAELFEAGDWALVRFSGINRESPVVIGFAEKPRECGTCGSAWPWRGLATSGVIALPDGGTKIMPSPPLTGNAWAVKNALVAGRIFAGVDIGSNAYIFVDDDQVCWHVSLTFSYPTENHVGIQASVIPWAEFGGSFTPAIYTATVDCEHIELTAALGNPFGDYDTRSISLSDVWTNGARALVDVVLVAGAVNDLFSSIELSLYGAGGEDGTGLIFSASEVFGQSVLMTQYSSGTIDPPANPFCGGLNWVSSPAYDYYLPYGRNDTAQWARKSFYNGAGEPQYLALFYWYYQNQVTCEAGWTSASGETCYDWEAGETIATIENHLVARVASEIGLAIMVTGAVIDHVTANSHYFMHEWYTTCKGGFFSGLFVDNDWAPSSFVITGSMSGDLSAVTEMSLADCTPLINGWRAANNNMAYGETSLGPVWFGLHRIDAASASFYTCSSAGSSRTYGTISTPIGASTYGSTTAGLYFAWQRKTGQTAFSTSPICFV